MYPQSPKELNTEALLMAWGARMPPFYRFPTRNEIYVQLTFESSAKGPCKVPALVDTGCSGALYLPEDWVDTFEDGQKEVEGFGGTQKVRLATSKIRVPMYPGLLIVPANAQRPNPAYMRNPFEFIIGLRILGDQYQIRRSRDEVTIDCSNSCLPPEVIHFEKG